MRTHLLDPERQSGTFCGRLPSDSVPLADDPEFATCKVCLRAHVPPEHGTYAAWNRHMRRGDPACPPCQEANAHYTAQYRAAHPEFYRRELELSKARSRALEKLARMFPAEFLGLLDDERSEAS